MPLFDMSRLNSKANDKKLARQANTTSRKTVPTVKGGNSLFDTVTQAQKMVEMHLGKYRDEYMLIQDEEVLVDYIDQSIKNGIISIDTETTGLDPLQDDITGICIYTPNQKGAYIPINHISYINNMVIPDQLDREFIRQMFERLQDINIVMFNAKFDIRFLRNCIGWKDAYCTWDAYLAQRLLNENEPTNALKKIHQKYVLDGKEDEFTFDELFKGIPFNMIPLQTAMLYAAHDPVITYELYDYQRKYLRPDSSREDMQRLYWVFKNIEMPCVQVVADMEDTGIAFDLTYNSVLSKTYNNILKDKLNAFYGLLDEFKSNIDYYKMHNPDNKLDEPINISSPTQLAILFYDILKYDSVDKKSPRGTGGDILLKWNTPLSKALIEYREVEKLISTYIDKLPKCVNPKDGRIHCNFKQYGAVTGRMASQDPNLQNIPSHNKDIRKMFVASDGYVLMSSDFSQQEPKCLAALCRKQGDSQMYDTFMQGKDLYSEIASKAFNKPYEECREFNPDGSKNKAGKERRTQAKSILLGVLYGRGVNSIAEQLQCTPEKAQAIKDSVFRGFPAIKKFEKDSIAMGEELGYVTTVCGRKRRLPDLQLDEYEFSWKDGAGVTDVLDFDDDSEIPVPDRTVRKYLTQLHNCKWSEKSSVIKKAGADGIKIVDNGGKIADATRQCVNSRIQGSAADLTKLAMIELNNNQRLKELGFRLLIPVHDEVIAECPEENVKECADLLAKTMSTAAEKILEMPIKCDVEVTKAWYGDTIDIGG